MKVFTAVLAIAALGALAPIVRSDSVIRSFSFQARNISGFPTGAVSLTGGGMVDPRNGAVHAGGGFRVTQDINQGPLNGLKAGDGVRWDAEQVLPSTPFKCTGSAGETLKNAFTNDNTIVLHADFYRAGDGNNAQFEANMFISIDGGDGSRPGETVVWIQGVGCDDAHVNLR